MAKKEDYKILEDVIKKLDIRRPMVYIEALIMEVSVTKQFELGVEWHAIEEIGKHKGSKVGILGGFITEKGPMTYIIKESMPPGFSFGILGDKIQIGGLNYPSLSAVIQAFKGDSDVNILSTPQILTTDNEEAEIKVGKTIPFVTRQEQTTTTGTIFSTYEYKDVGVTLRITPQINRERYVKLNIYQEVTKVVREQVEGTAILAPKTLKRAAKTTIIVKDGQNVVIGGLIDESLEKSRYQVPCLGGIPGLGWAFKKISKKNDRTNLFIFLTPHIIETPEEAKKVYEEKRGSFYGLKGGEVKLYER